MSMVRRLAELLAENRSRLLGDDDERIRAGFIDLFNDRADDYAQVDFGEGEADYKRLVSTECRLCADLLYLRPMPRPLAIVGLDSALHAIRAGLRPLERQLEQRGWRAKLRGLVRRARGRPSPGGPVAGGTPEDPADAQASAADAARHTKEPGSRSAGAPRR